MLLSRGCWLEAAARRLPCCRYVEFFYMPVRARRELGSPRCQAAWLWQRTCQPRKMVWQPIPEHGWRPIPEL